jgi:hypothetical protein
MAAYVLGTDAAGTGNRFCGPDPGALTGFVAEVLMEFADCGCASNA